MPSKTAIHKGQKAMSSHKSKSRVKISSGKSNVVDKKLSIASVAPSVRVSEPVKVLNLTTEDPLEKAIAEIDMCGSSSSSLVSDKECENTFKIIEESDFDLFELFKCPSLVFTLSRESDEEEEEKYLSSEDIDYVSSQSTVYSEESYFEQLTDMPQRDKVSLDPIEVVKPFQPIITREKTKIHSEDKGIFINPITGVLLETDISEESSIELVPAVQSLESMVSEEERDSFESRASDFSHVSTEKRKESIGTLEDTIKSTSPVDYEHEAYLQFMELETEEAKEKPEETADQFQLSIDKLMREQEQQLNFQQTMEFLKNLIEQAVDFAECKDENVVLRKRLDKFKLMQQLDKTLNELAKEENMMAHLNHKCTQHFRRKNAFHHIGYDYSVERQQKYYENLQCLDQLLKREIETKAMCNENIRQCKEQYEIEKQKAKEDIDKLEQLITSAFQSEKFNNLKACVNSQIEKMSLLRQTISRIRLRLLIDQHNFTDLSLVIQEV